MTRKNLYLIFRALIEDLTESRFVLGLDPTAIQLLEKIAIQNMQSKPFMVTDAMQLANIASPATIHRKILILKNANLIKGINNKKNKRNQYLVPSSLAKAYFHKLSMLMIDAQKFEK